MENIPEARLIPPSTQPKTQAVGEGWYSVLCPSTWVNFATGVMQMAVMTNACKDIEKADIQKGLKSQEIDRFDQPPISERKAAKAKEEAFRKRMREETTLSSAEQEKYVQRFRLRETLVDINYRQELRLKKTISVLGNTKDTQAIERGRTIDEPPIVKRDIVQVEETPWKIIIKHLEPSELLKLALKVDIKTKEEKFQEEGPVGSFQKEIYEPNKKNFKIIFDKIDEALNNKRFPDFDRAEFNKEIFKKNPINFLIEINTNHDRTDLQFIVNELSKDPEFTKTLDIIQNASKNYFERSILAARAFDKEYMADAKNYDKLNYIMEEIHENYEPDEWDDMEAAFKDNFGELDESTELRLAAKEKEQFDKLFTALIQNDSEYQAAQKIVQGTLSKYSTQITEKPFDSSDFSKIFFENKEFRDAYLVINRKYQAICGATGFQFKYNENFEIDPTDYVGFLMKEGMVDAANYVKSNPGRFIYSPLVVLGTALVGWQVAPAAALAVFTGHVIKQVAPTVTKEIEKAGVFYDIRQARLDREFRHPLRIKLLSKEFSQETKIEKLQELHAEGLLFQEDLADCPADLLKEIDTKIDTSNLPSIEKAKNTRKQPLKILNKKTFATDQMRLNALQDMANANVLYREDLVDEDLNIQRKFLEQNASTLEDFPSIDEESQRRNRNLYIAKGVLIPDFEKLKAVKTLHEKGVFFQEDLLELEKEFPDLHAQIVAQGLTLDKLPETAMHYRTELSLKAEHDKIRENILSKEGNLKDGIPTLKGLEELYREGLCFKQDLANIDEETRTGFVKFLSTYPLADTIETLPDQETFYQYGLAKQVVKFAEAVGKIIWEGGEAVYNNPANVVYGPLKGAKGITEISAKALEETFGTFTDIKTTALSDRVATILPGDKKLKAHAAYITNKTIGTVKWSVIGAGIVGTLASLFGLGGTAFGMQVGAVIGSFFGMCRTDGAVNQIPKGGFIRAFKFASYGALVGAVVAIALIAAGPIGWAAGAVTLSAAIIVTSISSSLIVPLVLLGTAAGYYYAGISGKDEAEEKEEKDIADTLYYRAPNIEPAFLASVPA